MAKRKWLVVLSREQAAEVLIEAEDDEEAERLAFKMMDDGEIRESAWFDTGEVDVECVGEPDD